MPAALILQVEKKVHPFFLKKKGRNLLRLGMPMIAADTAKASNADSYTFWSANAEQAFEEHYAILLRGGDSDDETDYVYPFDEDD